MPDELSQLVSGLNGEQVDIVNQMLDEGTHTPQEVVDIIRGYVSKNPAHVTPPSPDYGSIRAPQRPPVPSGAEVGTGGMPLTTEAFQSVQPGDIALTPQDVMSTAASAAATAAGSPELAPAASALISYLFTLPHGQRAAILEGTVQGVLDAVPAAGSVALKKFAPLRGEVDEAGEALLRVIGSQREPAKLGVGATKPVDVSLDLVTRNAWVDRLAGVSEGALFGKKMSRYKTVTLPQQRREAVERALNRIFDSDVTQLQKGGIVDGARKIADTIGDELGTAFYDEVWKAAEQNGLDVSLQTLERATGMSRMVDSGAVVLEKPTLYRTAASKMGDTPLARVINDLAGLYDEFGDNIPLREAELLQQRIGREIGATKERVPKKILTELKKELSDTIKNKMDEVPGLVNKYTKAKKFWGEFSEGYRNEFVDKFITDMAKKHPEQVAEKAFRFGNVSDIVRLKKVLSGAPEALQAVQRAHLQGRIEKGALGRMGNVPEGKSALSHLMGMSREQIEAAYPAPLVKDLNDLALALQASSRKSDAGGGKMLIQLTQGAQVVGMASAAFGAATDRPALTGGGLILLGGPLVLGHLLTNPTFVRAMTVGLRTPVKSQLANSVMSKVLAEVIKTKTDIDQGKLIDRAMEAGRRPKRNAGIKYTLVPVPDDEAMEFVKP